MTNNPANNNPQQVAVGGNNVTINGRDQITTNRTNVSFFSGNTIFFIFIAILSLGAAWAFGIRIHLGQNGIELKFSNPEQPSQVTESSSSNQQVFPTQ